jgi:predicted methyltransferase
MTRLPQTILALACLVTAPLGYCIDEAVGLSSNVLSAVADPRRPREQTAQDARRKPGEMIAFAGVKAGDRVVDFMSGGAYFTRLLSDVVTNAGHVYAFLPTEEIKNCPPAEIAGTRAVEHDVSYRNVTVVTASVDNFAVPVPVDVIWTAQNYHDLHDAFMGPANVAKLNKAFFDALKPGGVFLVIDHAAEAGSGLRDTETLHRIDPTELRREIEAAGFAYEASSDALANAGDDHRRRVFDPAIRGRTDQVVYRFRKPAAVALH